MVVSNFGRGTPRLRSKVSLDLEFTWVKTNAAEAIAKKLRALGKIPELNAGVGRSEYGVISGRTASDIFEAVAGWVGPVYLPVYESRPMAEIDRRGSCVGAMPYVTSKYPWPRSRKGDVLMPICQIDLDEISGTTGTEVGSGLLQVWRDSRRVWSVGHQIHRLIPRKAVDGAARLLAFPKADANDLAREWKSKIVDHKVLEFLFEEESEESKEYLAHLYFWGLMWEGSSIEPRDSTPWWAGGQYAGGAPWQVVNWRECGFGVPRSDFLWGLRYDIDTGWDTSYWEGNADKIWDKVQALTEKADKAWYRLFEQVSCADMLFGMYERPFGQNPQFYPDISDEAVGMSQFEHADLTNGWRPFFTVEGPSHDNLAFLDITTIFCRQIDGRFEYREILNFDRY